MLTEIYIEAFDEELADRVWEAWHTSESDDETAYMAWMLIAGIYSANDQHRDTFKGSRQ